MSKLKIDVNCIHVNSVKRVIEIVSKYQDSLPQQMVDELSNITDVGYDIEYFADKGLLPLFIESDGELVQYVTTIYPLQREVEVHVCDEYGNLSLVNGGEIETKRIKLPSLSISNLKGDPVEQGLWW